MCSKPKISSAPPPPPIQAAKAPDNVDLKARNRNQTGGFMTPGSTLLTGPDGVGSVSTGRSTLLGG